MENKTETEDRENEKKIVPLSLRISYVCSISSVTFSHWMVIMIKKNGHTRNIQNVDSISVVVVVFFSIFKFYSCPFGINKFIDFIPFFAFVLRFIMFNAQK